MHHHPNTLISQSLAYRIDEKSIFKNINFTINEGETLWIQGTNGSGKSTLLKIISGLINPLNYSGQLFWNNNSLLNTNYLKNYKRNIGYFSSKLALKDELTVFENIKYWSYIYSVKEVNLTKILDLLNLRHLSNVSTKFLSLGQKKRLSLVRILIKNFKILILDEPTLGLDSFSIQFLEKILKNHVKYGGILLIVSHTFLKLNNLTLLKLN